jgi:hypothetical protein
MDQPKILDYAWWTNSNPKRIQGNAVEPLFKAQQGLLADTVKLAPKATGVALKLKAKT